MFSVIVSSCLVQLSSKTLLPNFPPKKSGLLCSHCVLVPVTIFLLSHWLTIGHTHNVHSRNNRFSIMGMILNIEINIIIYKVHIFVIIHDNLLKNSRSRENGTSVVGRRLIH